MRNLYRIIRLIVLITLFIPQYSSAQKKGPLKVDAQAAGQKFLPDVLLVKFKTYAESPESAASANALLTINGAVGHERLFKSFKTLPSPKSNVPDLRTVFRVFLAPGSNVKAIAARLSADPRIEYAEPDYIFSIDGDPNDPFYQFQFQFPQVSAPDAWVIATGDPTVIVAIIDTGVDWDHPDLKNNIWNNADEIDGNGLDDDDNGYTDDIRGWDFVTGREDDAWPGEDAEDPDNNPMDFHGHGTHVAGIASAATNNAVGVASISFGITIMPLRIGWMTPDGGGLGLSSWMALAYIYAANNGAHVTSLSFGNSKTVLTGALYAFNKGVVIVHAAGNDDNEIIPDALGTVPWAISVAALTNLDRKAGYSSYGDWVTVSAPGGDALANGRGILSTIVTPSDFYGGNSYVEFSGTSMSSPMVAGLVGLVKSHFPEMSAAELMFQVVETADNIDVVNPSYIGKLGTGRINAYRALTETVVAPPKIRLSSVTVFNITGGDGDGVLEAGESADIMVSFENSWGDAINLSGTLSSTDWAITIDDNASIFPDMPGLTDLNNNVTDNSADLFSVTVNADAIPHTAEFSLDLTAVGYTETLEFQIGVFQPLLFVDDDHGDNNVESYYTDTFNDLNLSYITVENFSNGNPPANMADFPLVIWGSEWAFPSLDASDRAAIGTYLDGGGNLLIAGQDIGWDLNDPTTVFVNEFFLSGGASKDWYENYLRSIYISDDSNNDNMVGVPGDPIGDGLSFSRLQPGLLTDEQFPSEISANTGASEVFTYTGSPGNAGAVRYKNAYGVVNFAFGGIESITNSEIRTEIVRRSIAYLTGLDVSFTELTDTELI
ncbi:MAG: S8 family serine peptidase, partial [Candidatus Marinimicrobia bacterium]|nr:S8 family serine peptidase [Candidatus Neomarinimicrobiota bacterium]